MATKAPLTPEDLRLLTRKPDGPYLIETMPRRPVAGPQPLPEPPNTLPVEFAVWRICHFWLSPLRLVSAFVSHQRQRGRRG